MSKKHPVIAVTGSSGAGTSTVKLAFEHIFFREKIKPAIVEGDSFHRYDRHEMAEAIDKAAAEGKSSAISGPTGTNSTGWLAYSNSTVRPVRESY